MGKKQKSAQRQGGIDWEAVWLAWGLGILVAGVGALILWATLTAPPGKGPGAASRAISVSYGIARMLPTSVASRLAAALGGLFILGGALMFLMGFTKFFPSNRKPKA
jgi:hypothetical protein